MEQIESCPYGCESFADNDSRCENCQKEEVFDNAHQSDCLIFTNPEKGECDCEKEPTEYPDRYLDSSGELIYPRKKLRNVRNYRRTTKNIVDPIWIVVQEIERVFAGHEEGGHYQDLRFTLEVRKSYTWQNTLKIIRELKEEYPQPKYNRYSVLGKSDYEIFLCYCEEHFPSEQHTIIPYQ